MILLRLLVRMILFGFKILVASVGMTVIFLLGFELLNFNLSFEFSNPLPFIGGTLVFVLALAWWMVTLSISRCRNCKFVIAWSRFNKDWFFYKY